MEVAELGYFRIISSCSPYVQPPPPSTFYDVLEEWGCHWMWDTLQLDEDMEFLAEAFADKSLMTATDGSFMVELNLELCSAAFFFECTKGRGKLVGSFPDATCTATCTACAYRGELLGLLAVHLISLL